MANTNTRQCSTPPFADGGAGGRDNGAVPNEGSIAAPNEGTLAAHVTRDQLLRVTAAHHAEMSVTTRLRTQVNQLFTELAKSHEKLIYKELVDQAREDELEQTHRKLHLQQQQLDDTTRDKLASATELERYKADLVTEKQRADELAILVAQKDRELEIHRKAALDQRVRFEALLQVEKQRSAAALADAETRITDAEAALKVERTLAEAAVAAEEERTQTARCQLEQLKRDLTELNDLLKHSRSIHQAITANIKYQGEYVDLLLAALAREQKRANDTEKELKHLRAVTVATEGETAPAAARLAHARNEFNAVVARAASIESPVVPAAHDSSLASLRLRLAAMRDRAGSRDMQVKAEGTSEAPNLVARVEDA